MSKYSYTCTGCEGRVSIAQSYARVIDRRNPDRICRKCNKAIGIFKDSSILLKKAMDYVSKFEDKQGHK